MDARQYLSATDARVEEQFCYIEASLDDPDDSGEVSEILVDGDERGGLEEHRESSPMMSQGQIVELVVGGDGIGEGKLEVEGKDKDQESTGGQYVDSAKTKEIREELDARGGTMDCEAESRHPLVESGDVVPHQVHLNVVDDHQHDSLSEIQDICFVEPQVKDNGEEHTVAVETKETSRLCVNTSNIFPSDEDDMPTLLKHNRTEKVLEESGYIRSRLQNPPKQDTDTAEADIGVANPSNWALMEDLDSDDQDVDKGDESTCRSLEEELTMAGNNIRKSQEEAENYVSNKATNGELTCMIEDLNMQSLATTNIPPDIEGVGRSIHQTIGRIEYALQYHRKDLTDDKKIEEMDESRSFMKALTWFFINANESLAVQWSREVATKESVDLNRIIDIVEQAVEEIAGNEQYQNRHIIKELVYIDDLLLKEWNKRAFRSSGLHREKTLEVAVEKMLPESDEEDDEVEAGGEDDEVGNETMDFIPYAPILRKVSNSVEAELPRTTRASLQSNDGASDEQQSGKPTSKILKSLSSSSPRLITKARPMLDPDKSPMREYDAMCHQKLESIKIEKEQFLQELERSVEEMPLQNCLGHAAMADTVKQLKQQVSDLGANLAPNINTIASIHEKLKTQEVRLERHSRSLSAQTEIIGRVFSLVCEQQGMLKDLVNDKSMFVEILNENRKLKVEGSRLRELMEFCESTDSSPTGSTESSASVTEPAENCTKVHLGNYGVDELGPSGLRQIIFPQGPIDVEFDECEENDDSLHSSLVDERYQHSSSSLWGCMVM